MPDPTPVEQAARAVEPLTPGQFVEKEARRLSGRLHRGAIPARHWRAAIDAQAHDHDPSSCGECREDFLLRFGVKSSPEPDRESSCMVCGLVSEPGVWNDPTGVYVCVRCRDAARDALDAAPADGARRCRARDGEGDECGLPYKHDGPHAPHAYPSLAQTDPNKPIPGHTITPECGPICWTTGHHHSPDCDGCRRLIDMGRNSGLSDAALDAAPADGARLREALAQMTSQDRRGQNVWLSHEATGMVIDGLVLVIAEAKRRGAANPESSSAMRIAWAEEIIQSLSLLAAPDPAPPAPDEAWGVREWAQAMVDKWEDIYHAALPLTQEEDLDHISHMLAAAIAADHAKEVEG